MLCSPLGLLLSLFAIRITCARLAPDSAEVINACYFSYALRLDLPGSSHHTIRAADFQKKVNDFYAGLPVAAPLEEAYWVLSLPENFQNTIVKECPAMVMLAYFLVAETKLYVDPDNAIEYSRVGMDILRGLQPRLVEMLMESWPLQLAMERFQITHTSLQALQSSLPERLSIDFVVAHCKEDLTWLQVALAHWAPLVSSRLFLYEKCGEQGDAGGFIPTTSVPVVDGPPGGRKDECSAYLTHLIRATASRDVAHYTLFLQSDALHHTQAQLLNLVMHSIRHRTLDVPFLHLSRAQMVSSTSRCKRAIFHQVMGHEPSGVPHSYCCAQFLVRHDNIMQPGVQTWTRALAAMDASLPQGCEAARQAAGMHCLVYESIWHVMFGMPEHLNPRANDISLPIFLRIPESDSSDLPGGANSTVYLTNAVGNNDNTQWMDELEVTQVDVTGARSIGYSTASP